MPGAGARISVEKLLAESYKVLAGYQDWAAMGAVFYHWHGLELLVHSDNKKLMGFQLVLLLFVNSLQTMHSFPACTQGWLALLFPLLGMPLPNTQLANKENSFS